ncbi:MAG: UDP-N-acetylmuramoyl-L-alanyl-D-glutamate--2,6-diaminopimelate ligase, partial [Actinomycetota bacterium]|nr:UDP-N-acetylmuramoyl-L-alanyl-D-glutamate--2,6-diaminopimelate ligase [Actinomycetota bacterium]
MTATPARYPFAFDPVAEPRGRARVRWHDLLAGLDGVELTGEPDVEVAAITHDSRLVTPGACFACIPGAVTDGHEYAGAAVAAGAVALLVERPLPFAVAQARVASVRAALGPVAATLYGQPSTAMRTLGVTGTNGKTTTTYLLEAVARRAGDRVGVIGTVGARLTSAGGVSADGAGETLELRHTTPEASELQALLARMRDA